MSRGGHTRVSLPTKIGRYEVVAPLAAGGMAEILLARLVGPSGFESTVVIKRILPHLARNEAFVAMFLDEARIASRIRHANVVYVHELGSDGDDLYLVMEYLAGETASALHRALTSRGRALPPELAAFIVAEACAGLHAAHELTGADGTSLNLVHRDVSPQNLFVTYEGEVKVLDFGIAKAADRVAKTESGVLKGKFDYMSPEQCRGQELDRRTDIFALGVVLYELSTGRRLWKRTSQLATLKAITEEPIVPPSRLIAGYPKRLEAICLKALARDRNSRYSTGLEMRRELLAAIRERESTSSAPGDECDVALGALIRELFSDRVAAKREMLRRVSSGSELTNIPTDDDLVDRSPAAPEEASLLIEVETRTSLPSRASWKARPGVFIAVGVATLAVVAFALGRGSLQPRATSAGTPPPSPTSRAEPLPDPRGAPVEKPAPPPRTIAIHVETTPPGAMVLFGGVERGVTPFDLDVPSSVEPRDIELRRDGYVTIIQHVTPDVDQKLVLTLQRSSPPADRGPARRRRPPAPPTAAPSTPPPPPATEYPKF